MRFLIQLSLLWSLCLPFVAKADDKAYRNGCDTLVTQSGQLLLVHILEGTDSTLRFHYCNDSTQIETLPMSKVRAIRKGPTVIRELTVAQGVPVGAIRVDLIEEERSINKDTKLAALFGIGASFLSLFAFFFSPMVLLLIIPFSIAGIVFANRVLRKSRKKQGYKQQRGLAIAAIVSAIVQLSLVLVYFLLILFFLLLLF